MIDERRLVFLNWVQFFWNGIYHQQCTCTHTHACMQTDINYIAPYYSILSCFSLCLRIHFNVKLTNFLFNFRLRCVKISRVWYIKFFFNKAPILMQIFVCYYELRSSDEEDESHFMGVV